MEIQKFTPETIVNFALKNNIEFEYYTNILDRWDDRGTMDSVVGLELKKDVWYWWTIMGMTYQKDGSKAADPDPLMMFAERYNRNNGASIKSWRKGYDAQNIILNN
jgi:hypothetical protein